MPVRWPVLFAWGCWNDLLENKHSHLSQLGIPRPNITLIPFLFDHSCKTCWIIKFEWDCILIKKDTDLESYPLDPDFQGSWNFFAGWFPFLAIHFYLFELDFLSYIFLCSSEICTPITIVLFNRNTWIYSSRPLTQDSTTENMCWSSGSWTWQEFL